MSPYKPSVVFITYEPCVVQWVGTCYG